MTPLERDREPARIAGALDSAVRGEGRVVVVEGRAGIGKTRLVEATRELAKARGFGRLQAVGDALESAMAWGVVRQLVERSVSRYRGGTRAAILAGPAGDALRALDAAADDPGEAGPARTLHALWWVAVDLSATRPLLITVDVAHWADPSSLHFLVYLARRIADLPIALVVATRPPEADTGPLAQLCDARRAERLPPRPLTPGALADLVAARGARPAADVVAALHEASAGNPFLAGVLVDELESLGLPLDAPATADRVGGLGPAAVFRAVLGRLPDDAVRLAGAVAVLGSGGDPWLAGAVAGLPPAALPDAVGALVGAHVLTGQDDHLVFAHPVVREAVLTELGPVARAALHAEAATRLRAAQAPADRIAAHLARAPRGALPDAADVLRRAAAALLAAGDAGTAAAHLARAVEERPDDAGLRAEWGRALLRTGAAAEAQHQLRAAARDLPNAELVAAAASATAVVEGPEAAIAELSQAVRALPGGDGRLHLEARLAVTRSFLRDQRHVASEHLGRYAALRGGTPDERTLLGLLAQMGRYEVRPSRQVADTALRALSNGAYFDDATGGTDAMVAWVVAVIALVSADGVEEARREVDRARLRVRRHGSPVEFAMVANAALFLNWRLGNADFVEAEAEGALAAVKDEDPVQHVVALRATATHFAAYAALEHDDVAGARRALARFDAEHPDPPRMMPTLWLREPRALVALAAATRWRRGRGRSSCATRCWPPGSTRRPSRGGTRPRGRRCCSAPRRRRRRWASSSWPSRGSGARQRKWAPRCGCSRTSTPPAASSCWRNPSRCWRPRPPACSWPGRWWTSGRRCGWPAAAPTRAPLLRGIDLAAECGSPALRARAAEALEALGDRPRRLPAAGAAALTASERRVADLAAVGRANREIAQELFVTPKTVENHLSRIYTKLGINGRRELARVLARKSA